jgi:hypothetical protein
MGTDNDRTMFNHEEGGWWQGGGVCSSQPFFGKVTSHDMSQCLTQVVCVSETHKLCTYLSRRRNEEG